MAVQGRLGAAAWEEGMVDLSCQGVAFSLDLHSHHREKHVKKSILKGRRWSTSFYILACFSILKSHPTLLTF